MTKKDKRNRRSNLEAIKDFSSGATQKKFSVQDLRTIYPKNHTQSSVFDLYGQGYSLVLSGSPGTGKSFLALYLALREVLSKETKCDRVMLVRSPTPTKDIGHLPGTEQDKAEVYEKPYMGICGELFKYSKSYLNLKKGGYIDFRLTSFIRGETLDNTIVILDEAASCTMHEIDTVVTRLGRDSKIIICGDIRQSDLRGSRGGMADLLIVADKMDSFEIVDFLPEDIVRSGLVKEWILAQG